jgi:hypothetical protein
VAPHGTGVWQGPLLAAASFPGGLHPFEVTSYITVFSGQYDARVVAAGSTTCDLPDAGSGSPPADAGTPPADAGAPSEDAAADAAEDAAVTSEDAGTSTPDAGPPAPGVDFTSLPALAPNTVTTVVFVDPKTSSNIADVFSFTDDTTTTAGQAKLRFVNVSEADVVVPNAPIDAGSQDGGEDAAAPDAGTSLEGASFGIGGGMLITPVFTNVTSAAGIAASGNGYVDITPLLGVDSTLSTPISSPVEVAKAPSVQLPRPRGAHGPKLLPMAPVQGVGGTSLTSGSITLPAGGILTAFYATEAATGSPALVWCYDGQPSASSAALTLCGYMDSTTAQTQTSTHDEVRFGNFVSDADAGAVDVCARYHGFGGNYFGPLFAGLSVAGGVPAESLSGYMSFDGTFDYDVRFVAQGATDCATSIQDGTITVHDEPGSAAYPQGGGYNSALLVGYQNIPADAGTVPPYDAGPPEDAGADAGPQPVSAGISTIAQSIVSIEDEAFASSNVPAIRVVHVAADSPEPISMTFTDQSTGQGWSLDNVPYGGFSTQPPPVDPWGYATMTADPMTVQMGAYGTSYDIGNPSDQQSLFVLHGPNGPAPEILGCDDWDEYGYASASTQCCVLGSSTGACGSGGSGPSGGAGPTGG